MYNETVIGTGISTCSSIKIFKIKGDHYIYGNHVLYDISNVYLNLRLTIFKNTNEGMHLTSMIENETPLAEINEYLKLILFRNAEITLLEHAIDQARKQAFKDGEAAKVKEIKKILCIDDME